MNHIAGNDVLIITDRCFRHSSMRMFLWQKCTIVLLVIAIFGGAAYIGRIAFRPEGLARYRSIPWVTYVHPNVKKLKQARTLSQRRELERSAHNSGKHADYCAEITRHPRIARPSRRRQHANLLLQRTFAAQNRIYCEAWRRAVVDRTKAPVYRRGDHAGERP